jgi:hypothetical protein
MNGCLLESPEVSEPEAMLSKEGNVTGCRVRLGQNIRDAFEIGRVKRRTEEWQCFLPQIADRSRADNRV